MSRFGCWNIRSRSSRKEEFVDKMKRYRFKVLGVYEAKMKGNGIKRIGDATCVYSGLQGGRSKAGVAISSEKFGVFLREWKCIDERITWIQLKIEDIWVTVVQVYAPTEDSSPGIKDEFFQKLQKTVGSMARLSGPDSCDG